MPMAEAQSFPYLLNPIAPYQADDRVEIRMGGLSNASISGTVVRVVDDNWVSVTCDGWLRGYTALVRIDSLTSLPSD